jgi:hypothetical protein
MDPNKKQRLERKFDRKLTDGEAAEIANTEVLHRDDEDFYENNDMEAGLDFDGDNEDKAGGGIGTKGEDMFRIRGSGTRYP